MEPVFRALGDPSRRLLLDRLLERDGQTLGELCRHLPGMTRFGVMNHLAILEEAGLVTTRRVGRRKLHYLDPVPIRLIHDRWIGRFAEPVVGAMAGLKQQLEGGSMMVERRTTTAPLHVYVTYIRATPEAIWAALTDGRQTDRYYYGTRVSSTWQVGAPVSYSYPDGRLAADGTVLESEPPRRLAMSFQARWSPELVEEGPVRMTWLIEPAGEGVSKLSVVQEGMGPRTRVEFEGGVPFIVAGLKSMLETGESLPMA
jgi:DNA-binding transcriptional ArsR family regulator/uncharacterized protein YndB with AHSA1/START domain